jgi:AcrR family transcriptional regulator
MKKKQTGTDTDSPNASAKDAGKAAGRRERKAAETRLRLFRAAIQLFADRGFPNVTVEDITEASDVGKGTFFNYFESKEHVLGVMAELQLAHVAEAVQAVHAGKQSIHAILHHLFIQLAKELGRSPHLARTVVASFLASDVVRAMIRVRLSEGRAAVAKILAAGQARGEVDPALDAAETAAQMQRSLFGTVMLWSLYGEPALSVCVESNFRLFWRAVSAGGREQKP